MAGVKVLKIRISAMTASFRYPRVQIGRLPTFEIMPPATVYGQMAAALGEWFDPAGLEFSHVFEHSGSANDVETIQPIERGSGRNTFSKRGWDFPVNVQCSANVQRRQFLLSPKLTLYVRDSGETRLERLREAFLTPHFPLLMGRSQDLASCQSSEIVELATAEDAFFADTLVPWEWRPWVTTGVAAALPSAIDYARNRIAKQDRYLHVGKPPLRVGSSDDVTDRRQLPERFAVDPSEMLSFCGQSVARGLWFWPVQGPGSVG